MEEVGTQAPARVVFWIREVKEEHLRRKFSLTRMGWREILVLYLLCFRVPSPPRARSVIK